MLIKKKKYIFYILFNVIFVYLLLFLDNTFCLLLILFSFLHHIVFQPFISHFFNFMLLFLLSSQLFLLLLNLIYFITCLFYSVMLLFLNFPCSLLSKLLIFLGNYFGMCSSCLNSLINETSMILISLIH